MNTKRVQTLNLTIGWSLAMLTAFAVSSSSSYTSAAEPASGKKIPVILDTDIGDDIDDTWALAMLVNSPEFDIKLVVGDFGKPKYRASIIAKFLQTVGRSDIPVGIGPGKEDGGGQSKWVEGYDLKSYPGKVHEDGIQAIIDTIMNSPEPITLLCIGPLPNIAAALKREPKIAEKARFVGMHGSVRVGYGGKKTPDVEWNVKADPKSCQAAFTAAWDMTITPLDTCGLIVLDGARYKAIYECKTPVAQALIENYRIWSNGKPVDKHSSTLFDCVAVYLAFATEMTEIEELGIRVTDDAHTAIDPQAKKIKVATRWKDMEAFKDLLVKRITK